MKKENILFVLSVLMTVPLFSAAEASESEGWETGTDHSGIATAESPETGSVRSEPAEGSHRFSEPLALAQPVGKSNSEPMKRGHDEGENFEQAREAQEAAAAATAARAYRPEPRRMPTAPSSSSSSAAFAAALATEVYSKPPRRRTRPAVPQPSSSSSSAAAAAVSWHGVDFSAPPRQVLAGSPTTDKDLLLVGKRGRPGESILVQRHHIQEPSKRPRSKVKYPLSERGCQTPQQAQHPDDDEF